MSRFKANLGISYMLFSVLHLCIFVLSLTVIGLYATDIQRAKEDNKSVDSKFGYAVFCGAISAITCIVYFIPSLIDIAGVLGTCWNLLMFVFWIALFGVFGSKYINKHAHGNGRIERMKNAVWVDLAGALLWLIASAVSAVYWWRHRDTRSLWTGRARV